MLLVSFALFAGTLLFGSFSVARAMTLNEVAQAIWEHRAAVWNLEEAVRSGKANVAYEERRVAATTRAVAEAL